MLISNKFRSELMKIKCISIFAMFLFLAGCDNSNDQTNQSNNISAKHLSIQNETDIRSDLKLLNPILNASNSEAITINHSLVKARQNNNRDEAKSIVSQFKKSLDKTNALLMSLDLKSEEVQKISHEIISGNVMAIKLQELFLNDNPTNEDKNEMTLLQKQLVTMQKNTGEVLDSLNNKYHE